MAHLADLPDVMGTLFTLKNQVQDAKGKLVSAREESAALREEQADLLHSLAEKEKTISRLKCRLTDEVQTQRKEVWRLARMYKSGRDPKIDRLKKQYAGPFIKSEKPGKAPEFAPAKEAQRTGKGITLRDMAKDFHPSPVRPDIISNHEWKVGRTEPLDTDRRQVTGQDEIPEGEPMEEDEISPRLSSFPAGRHDSLPVGTTIPERLASLKRRRSDFPAASHYFLPGDPRRDSLDDNIFARHKRPKQEPTELHRTIRRKPVCVSCWKENGICDFDSQCKRCRFQGIPCVHKLCSDNKCVSERCPCLHVGEWDEKDKSWILEPGRMPPKDRVTGRRGDGA